MPSRSSQIVDACASSLDVVEVTEEIILNAASDFVVKDVSIHSVALETEQTQASSELTTDRERERLSAKFATPLPKGSKAKLHIGWESKLRSNMLGTVDRLTFARRPLIQ